MFKKKKKELEGDDLLFQIRRDAIDMAAKAGEIQMDYFRTGNVSIDTKSNVYDVVTQVDKKCEELLINEISKRYPDHSILGEETGLHQKESDWEWVIDPLDGTNNYSQGLPVFCVSIGVTYKGETQVGVIYTPYLDELYTAVKGHGATTQMGLCMGELLPPEPLHVGQKENLGECVVATGFPYDKKTNPANNIKTAMSIIPDVRGIRRMGAAAYDLVSVALGSIDAYWELNLKPWDACAGSLIVQEAGGIVIPIRDDRNISILAGNEKIVEVMKKYIFE